MRVSAELAEGATRSIDRKAGEAITSDPTDTKTRLRELLDLLSPYECQHVLDTVARISVGDRFWEDDVAIFYNEYVKARYATYVRNPGAFTEGVSGTNGIYASVPVEKRYNQCEAVRLSKPGELKQNIQDVLTNRRSRRECNEKPLSLDELGTLLQRACGTTGHAPAYGYNNIPLRPYASSGALQSTEVYFFASRVAGLKPGLYHFNASDGAVELMKPGFQSSVLRAWIPGQPTAADAPVIFVFSGCYERLQWKYGARSYRYMCMDIGFLCQNIHLVAEAMGLAFCAIAGFIEDEIEGYLDIDGQNEMVLLTASLGHK